MRRSWLFGAVAAVVALVIGGAIGYYSHSPADVQKSSQYQDLAANYQDAQTTLNDTKNQLSDTKSQLTAAQTNSSSWKFKYDNLRSSIDEMKASLRDQRRRMKASLRKQQGKIDASKRRLNQYKAQLDARASKLQKQQVVAAQSQFPGDGTFVGGQDMIPGTYRSAGRSGCYYAFMDGTGAGANIIDNNLTDGPAIATINNGDIFQTQGCAEWVKE